MMTKASITCVQVFVWTSFSALLGGHRPPLPRKPVLRGNGGEGGSSDPRTHTLLRDTLNKPRGAQMARHSSELGASELSGFQEGACGPPSLLGRRCLIVAAPVLAFHFVKAKNPLASSQGEQARTQVLCKSRVLERGLAKARAACFRGHDG